MKIWIVILLILLSVQSVEANILDKVAEGIELLEPIKLEYEKDKKRQMALAILNTETGSVFEQLIWFNEDDAKNAKKDEGISIESEGLEVICIWWNDFNSHFEIKDRPEMIVVANKYLLPSKCLEGLPEKSGDEYTAIIYSPYSDRLHLPEIIEAGETYLDSIIDQAYLELEEHGTQSRFYNGELVTQNIEKNLIQRIILSEHIDPDLFGKEDLRQNLVERVLVIIGLNKGNAYRYTGSPANAYALPQFTTFAYNATSSRYDADLIKGIRLGIADHINAIKAMVCFFDLMIEEINANDHRDMEVTEEMLAAAYNGGGNRVSRAIRHNGEKWASSSRIPKETRIYLDKFRWLTKICQNLLAYFSLIKIYV